MRSPRTTFPGRDHRYDAVVVGAGIAGSEAAYRCARGGLDTLLVSTSLDTVYTTLGDEVLLDPPNGSLMRIAWHEHADESGRVGNWRLHRAAKYALEATPGLHLLQSSVTGVTVDGPCVTGVETWEGVARRGRYVGLCAGSFLRARLRIGNLTEAAGRLSEMAYDDLHDDLEGRGVRFRDERLVASPEGGSLPYSVRCRVLGPSSWDPATMRVVALEGLYAAGVAAVGYLTFERAAEEGMRLADTLLAASSLGTSSGSD